MWGSFGQNVYYDPAACGFELVGVLDADLGWEFDTLIVLKDEKGLLWAAHDRGCSCPTPFEDVQTHDDLTPIRSEWDLSNMILTKQSDYSPWSLGDRMTLQRKVREHLAAQVPA